MAVLKQHSGKSTKCSWKWEATLTFKGVSQLEHHCITFAYPHFPVPLDGARLGQHDLLTTSSAPSWCSQTDPSGISKQNNNSQPIPVNCTAYKKL